MQVEVEQAREQLTDLIEEAMRGSEVVITRGHLPLVRLVEVRAAKRRRRRPGSAKGLITIADDFDAPLDDGMRDGDRLAVVQDLIRLCYAGATASAVELALESSV